MKEDMEERIGPIEPKHREYENLLVEDFKTYAWLISKATEYKEMARKSTDPAERGRLFAASFEYEEEAHTLADEQSDNLMYF